MKSKCEGRCLLARNAERARFLIAPDIRHPNRRTTKAAPRVVACFALLTAPRRPSSLPLPNPRCCGEAGFFQGQ